MRTNDQLRNEAHQILQGEDFQQYAPKADMAAWLKDLLQWFQEHFHFQFSPNDAWTQHLVEMTIMGFAVVGILLLVFLLGTLLHHLYKTLLPAGSEDTSGWVVSQAERHVAHASYSALAQTAFEQQDYRLAMHYLFLATVSLVVQEEYFQASEFLTNREVAQVSDFSYFPQARKIHDLFQQMVQFDEPRWFGHINASAEDYQHFLSWHQQFHQQVNLHVA